MRLLGNCMNNFILICTDTHSATGRRDKRALQIASERLDARHWPLYKGTRNRRGIEVGDRVVVYIAGSGPARQSFYAATSVIGHLRADAREAHRLRSLAGDSPSAGWLILGIPERFEPCINAKVVLADLSFIPKNRARWGVAFMSGTRRISDRDWDVLLRAVPDKGK